MWSPLKRKTIGDQFEQFDITWRAREEAGQELTVAVEGPGRRPVKLGLLLAVIFE
jgi:hypothetical protein